MAFVARKAPEQPIEWPSAMAPGIAIDLLHIELEPARNGNRLGGEGFVRFDERHARRPPVEALLTWLRSCATSASAWFGRPGCSEGAP
jgi:hypothetical protein